MFCKSHNYRTSYQIFAKISKLPTEKNAANKMLRLVSEYVEEQFTKNLSEDITYHNLEHTREVVSTATFLGEKSKISESEMEMLLIAAWFHDLGIAFQYENHENKSVEICRKFLIDHNYPQNKVDVISKIIKSTKIPHQPKNLLEKIMCDADVSYTGKETFKSRSKYLRKEWENILGKKISDDEWLTTNINFLENIKFHTTIAKLFYDEKRVKHLYQLQKLILSNESKIEKKNDNKRNDIKGNTLRN